MTTKPSVFEALTAVQAAVKAVRKGDRNNEQGYNFRGIDAVVNAVGPALREHSVLVVPEVLEAAYRDVTTSRGKPSRECTVKVRYRFYGPCGDYIDAVTVGEAMDFGDKGTPKAMSVAFRVALLQALCLPTDEPDADSQSYERAHDEWETAKVPTDAQVTAFDDYTNRIKSAESEQDLQNVWELVKDARGNEKLTREQFNRLKTQTSNRIGELRGITQ